MNILHGMTGHVSDKCPEFATIRNESQSYQLKMCAENDSIQILRSKEWKMVIIFRGNYRVIYIQFEKKIVCVVEKYYFSLCLLFFAHQKRRKNRLRVKKVRAFHLVTIFFIHYICNDE